MFNTKVRFQMLVGNLIRTLSTSKRELLLDPNRWSKIKIERYDFSLNALIIIGRKERITVSLRPGVAFRPQKLIVNAPCPGFIYITLIQIANLQCNVGESIDGFSYSVYSNSILDFPTMSPANTLAIDSVYTGLRVMPYIDNTDYILCFTFQGPATIVR